jgi:CO dehydrogenase/acetyl-CoA synthase beta subunit
VANFDGYLKKVSGYLRELIEQGRPVREFACEGDLNSLAAELPVRVGTQASSGIILRGDTFAELGSPDAGSCAFPLWSTDPSLITDGRIRLVGSGIQESEGASLPFAQVLMVAGKDLNDEEHSALEQKQYVSDQIEGYMIRSTPGRMWSRVSKEAAGKGFDFDVLGKALVFLLQSQMPKIQAMEVVFVTSGKGDVQGLGDIAEQVRTIGKNIEREKWLARGYDIVECTLGVDWKSCSDKPVCDDIREVVKVRKKKTAKAATS